MIRLAALAFFILSALLYSGAYIGARVRADAMAREAQERSTRDMIAPQPRKQDQSAVMMLASERSYVGM